VFPLWKNYGKMACIVRRQEPESMFNPVLDVTAGWLHSSAFVCSGVQE
jgi:hypothetical protein